MKKILLVVDDEPDIVTLVKNRLEANNYGVISASDGEEGVRKAQQHKPDLILMDVLMPNLSGVEAVKILRSDAATKDIPIIFLTVLTTDTPQRNVEVDGEFYTTIAKPFEVAKLLSEIKRLMEGQLK